jgi:diguanylate cyclase (GGDEF)-like protein
MKPMKILIAEDDASTRTMLEGLTKKWGYSVVSVSDGKEALRLLEAEDGPSLALMDWLMPGVEGPEICRRLRHSRSEKDPYRYVILLTVKGEREHVVRGLEAGADDYVVKPFDPQELKVRLDVGRRIVELQEMLRHNARHDVLTELLNRRAGLERLKEECARSRRENEPLSVAVLDLDHFKNINDTYGHESGDEVLREAAQRLRKMVRSYDVIARLGGEEFLLLFPKTSRQIAEEICERIRRGFESKAFLPENVSVTASIGVASFGGDEDEQMLLRRADAALYEAKHSGRNLVRSAR